MENLEKIKEQMLAKLGNNPKLDDEIIKDIRKKTLKMGETLEEKEFENILCNVELELKKLKDPQSVAGIVTYCISRLPITLQKVMLEGQESIINAFFVKAVAGLLFEDKEEFEL